MPGRIIDYPSNFTCMSCTNPLYHRYKCYCDNEYGQCENRPACSFYWCRTCNSEEKVNQEQIDKENEQRGNDLTMENGEPARPDEERHWSEKEKEVLTEMLMKVASPGADWKSANELCAQRAASGDSLAATESLERPLSAWQVKQVKEVFRSRMRSKATLSSSPLPSYGGA